MTRPALLWTLSLTAAAASADHHEFTGPTLEPGFVRLFDGRTLDGWEKKGGEATYEVVDGAIVGTAVPNTPNTFLCTTKDYGDFELRLDYKCDDRLNSGIMFRAQSSPDYKDGRVHGYQCEIDPSDRAASAGIYDEARRGWLFPKKGDEEFTFADYKQKAGRFYENEGWNSVIIRCEGDRITTTLNGREAADLTDATDASGFIGLQVHGIGKKDPEPPMQVRWRNVRIKELN